MARNSFVAEATFKDILSCPEVSVYKLLPPTKSVTKRFC